MTQPIRPGEVSAQVADIQARLRALGIAITDEPGHFGPSTTRAVRAFQQERGVIVDGIVGPHTWGELVEAGWRLGDRSLYLRRPLMRGDDILVLQVRLNALGFDAGREDGIFGRDTAAAVRSFQKEYGVAEDGIFGPRTLAALGGLRADRPETAAGLREELWRTRNPGLAGRMVVVDPGHGGGDEGSRGRWGASESELCWDLALRVERRLAAAGASVRLSRARDRSPDVSARAELANDLGAELFISLHLNSHEAQPAEGTSTYYFPRSRAGQLLAEAVQDKLVELGLRDCRSHARSYPLLKETRMPAVLIEPAFISNPDDAKRLTDPDFREAVAAAIASAIATYCST